MIDIEGPVLDAVRAGDPAAAESAMRYALRDSHEDLRSGEPPFEAERQV